VELASVEFPVDDVALLQWRLPGGEQLGYLAGQHLDVILEDGRRRSFSIANAPHAGEGLEMHVRHVQGGGFTDQVFGDLKAGDSLEIEAPLGTFFLRDRSPRPMICVAGGTGFSPIKAIVEEALLLGDERPLHIYWGARSEAELYLQDLPRRWARQHEHIVFVPVISGDPQPGWDGRTGFVHEAVLADFNNLSPFDVYMSGPPPMIDGARREFIAHGLPEHHLYYDSFEFAPDVLAKMRPAEAG
jgi:CDP-4-dehydro-6-deoxyglucose reductase